MLFSKDISLNKGQKKFKKEIMETQYIGNSSSTLSRDSPEMAIKEYSKG